MNDSEYNDFNMQELVFDDVNMVINYKGVKYPYRIIKYENLDLIVSTVLLEDTILTDDYDYVDDLAQFIDECIVYYVDPDEIDKEDKMIFTILVHVLS